MIYILCQLEILETGQALMSDHGYLLIQAIFQALQLYSWGFAVIKLFRSGPNLRNMHIMQVWPSTMCILASEFAVKFGLITLVDLVTLFDIFR